MPGPSDNEHSPFNGHMPVRISELTDAERAEFRALVATRDNEEAHDGYQASAQVAHDGANDNGIQSHAVAEANMNAMMNQFGGLGINGIPHIPGMMPMTTQDGRIIQVAISPSMASGVPTYGIPTLGYAPAQPEGYAGGTPYIVQPGYANPAHMYFPYTPSRTGMSHERTETSSRDVPGLDIRRSSYSTNESTPATPFLGSMASRDQGPRVTVFDRSTYTTPSPHQIVAAEALQEPKSPLLDREPSIPFAIPAVFTPAENMKTLEQSLVNPLPGNRNVYIRGFHPTTDDTLLLKYAERFGKVETSKAIIDASTGACKGFGFAKFYDVRDSENCIRGFYRRGYEVGFARESFNSRLRQEGDPDTTNLYLSNLPRGWRELEINTLFQNFLVLSSKVLEDQVTHVSRGVGFARFESREVCDSIIKHFQGMLLGRENLPLQIRYADSQRQKELKRVTAKRRQWRTNEYNVSAYGTTLVGAGPSHGPPYRHNGGAGGGQGGNSQRAMLAAQQNGPQQQNGSQQQGGAQQQEGTQGRRPHGSGTWTGMVDTTRRTGEDVEIRVESPLVAHGSNQSSPVKQEKE
ncbi:uncharacterized protein GGS22DRAFT_184577 [Annulohypoxylon maeteangense]|uniref:uncharacterized protein n=1 Tax=Annulohypoxylon maeteangense TaxID=1927788 RepID=UPI0020088A80|nr:uncharacterized protein GGS22DRAFT_184577 [Annulohypoxylon maeteangense]KAI0889000.1 hypothetical protein GGS22DRAFT_184577 [Annulohypoxylon maeteangense]